MGSRRIACRLMMTAAVATFGQGSAHGAQSEGGQVTRATLANGLRVVVVHDSLAPVATVEMNVLAGADETPPGFPGMAHAQEHMAFRGCDGMNADQTAAIYAQLGGRNNADTQQTITQYYATVPAADIDVALQAQAACLRGIDDTQAEWAHERGAIEQEVARDLSNPTYKFIDRLNRDMFAGTPYAHDPLGTRQSFEATTGALLEKFYKTWYSPSDAILVVVGDVDAAAVIPRVVQLFGSLPARAVPTRPVIALRPVKSDSFTLDSNLPYSLGFIAFRLPGTLSKDYAAVQVLSDVLSSPRGDLYEMVTTGKALAAEFALGESYPAASVGIGVVALPAGGNAAEAIAQLRSILMRYARDGIPADLVAAARRSELAAAEFQRNSIPELANVWSNALAAEGRQSPDEDVEAIRRVTVADVNRIAAQYLKDQGSITATLKPVATGKPVATKGFGGSEQVTSAPTKPVTLPAWAAASLSRPKIPADDLHVSDTRLPNGIRLIVRTDTTSATVSVLGAVKHDADLQTPPGKEGVDDLLTELFSYGTLSLDRVAYQTALDEIAARESAGFHFSVSVLKEHFSRAVELLADNELHPALPEKAFGIVKGQTTQFVAGNLQSPEYKSSRALDLALLPADDPVLRQVTPATVSEVTLADVRRYHGDTIRPDLTTIVVIGDVSAEDARSVIEKWFGGWSAAGAAPNTTLPAVRPNAASAVHVSDPQAVQDTVVLAQQLDLNRLDPDYYPLQLGNHVLGGGFYATRLYHDLRQVAGYVYNIDVSLDASKTRADYLITYGCNPDTVSKARVLVARDLDQMRTQDVSAGELDQAKALLLRQLPLGESSETAVALGLLGRAEAGLPLDEPIIAARTYYALDAGAVRAAFARRIRPADFVQVVRGPVPQ